MILTKDKKVWLPDGDTWDKWNGDWELNEYNEVMQHISERTVAIDIGAHVGLWSKRLVKDFKHVYCFEPVKKHIECWHKNLNKDFNDDGELVYISNVDIYDVALSDVEGTSEMSVPFKNSGMSTLNYHEYIPNDYIKENVQTRTLDSYDFNKIDFIKIDVEDHEYKVLRGARKTIEKYKPILYMEINDQQAIIFLESLKLGYKLIYGDGMNRLFKSNTVVEELREILKTQK